MNNTLRKNENHIELKLFDFDLSHEEISITLGIESTKKWYKDENYSLDSESKKTTRLRKENYWGLEVVTVTNDYIGDQVDDFINTIVIPRTERIKKLTENSWGEFSIVQYMYDGCNPGFFLEKKQIAILSNCGLGLNVDIYVLSQSDENN